MSVTTGAQEATSDKKLSFIATMSGGLHRLTRSKKGAEKPAAKIVSHDITIDISDQLKAKLKVGQGPAKDWWDDLMSHLPPLQIVVSLQAEEAVWTAIEANWKWEDQVTRSMFERVDAGMAKLASELVRILVLAENDIPPVSEPVSPKVQKAIDGIWARCTEDCAERMNGFGERVAEETADEMRELIADLKEVKSDVRTYRFIAGARVVKNIVLIAGNIAHAAASWGATSPLAIIAIARSCVEIGHIVAKGMMNADQMGEWVKIDLLEIQAAYSDDKGGKTRNNVIEVITNAVNGVMNLELPSVRSCKIHIKDYDHDVNVIDIDYARLGEKLKKLSEEMTSLHGKVAAADNATQPLHKNMSNADAVKQFTATIEKMNKGFDGLFTTLPELEKQIAHYREKSAKWREALESYQVGEWTKYVTLVASIATDAGLGMGHVSGEHVETAAEIASQHLKEGLEATTIFLSGASDTFLEVIGE
jgi:hypothetical protein